MNNLEEWKSLIVARLQRVAELIDQSDVQYAALKDLDVAESDLYEVVVRIGVPK